MSEFLKSDIEEFREVASASRKALEDDPYRPQYHFTAPRNWLNDPNGLIQWNGQYHLFYQYNPFSPISDTKHWGHAVSHDLIHWDDLPIALAPTPGSYDADGIYSGTAVNDNGVPTILYSGVRGPHQMVCVATGDESLLRWTKYEGNPVVADFPPGLDLLTTDEGKVHYRDPSVWRSGSTWSMIVGSGIARRGGTVLLYQSADLREWEYKGPLLVGDMNQHQPFWTGTMWECPQLFPLDGKHVLLVSVWHDRRTLFPAYMTGTYEDGRFTPEYASILDPGSHYAPQTLLDDQGRRVLFGWLREQRGLDAMCSSKWNGAMSIPWILSLASDGSMRYSPAPELEMLRGQHHRFAPMDLNGSDTVPLAGVSGDSLELQATIAPETATTFGLVVRCSPNREEQTRIVYSPESRTLHVDKDRASLDEATDRTRHDATVALPDGEALQLRIFLDRSIIEIVANNRILLSERIYPTRTDSLGVGVFAEGGSAHVCSVEAWEMGSSWER